MVMLKLFFKNGLIYSISTFLTQGIAIILIPFYSRTLTTTEYGIIDILNIIGMLLRMSFTLEVSQAIARYYNELETQEEKTLYSSTAFLFSGGIFLVVIIIFIIFRKDLSRILISSDNSSILIIGVLSAFFSSLYYFLQLQLRWQLKAKINAIINITNALVTISSTIFLVLFLKIGVVGVFYGSISGSIIGGILSWIQVKEDIKLKVDVKILKKLILFSAPLVPSSIGVYLSMYVDRIIMKSMLSLSDVGIYGIGYRISSAVGILLMGFQNALVPLIYKNYKEESTREDLSRIFSIFVLCSNFMFLSISLFSREILLLFTTPEYEPATTVIPFLVLSILISNFYMFAPGLSIAKKTGIIAILNISIAVLASLLNLFMIPISGKMGAAVTSLLCAIINATANLLFSKKYYAIPFKWKGILSSIVISAIFVLVGLFWVPVGGVPGLIMKLFLLISGLVISMIILVGISEIKRTIRKIMITLFSRISG